MEESEIFRIFLKFGVLIENGHYVYKEWEHGDTYVNKDALFPHTGETALLCSALAERFINDDTNPIEAVIGPESGGAVVSQWVASYLRRRTNRDVLSLRADKAGDDFVIKRGYDKLIKKKFVLVVEDVVNKGSSVKKVIAKTRECGGIVIGVGALWNRGNVKIENVPNFLSLVNKELPKWDPKERPCPLCEQNIPINTDLGRGAEFLAQKQLQR